MDRAGYKRIWRRTCLARAFELQVAEAHRAKKLPPAPIYLSVGTEHVAATLAECLNVPSGGDFCNHFSVFPQHRGHSWYLNWGGDPGELVDEILGRSTGCAGGMGGSASMHCPKKGVFGHSGLLADQVPIAAGYALGSGKSTLVVLGDAAAEEDYTLATLGFAVSKKLPILFVVEDNDLSILTKTEVRRSWEIKQVAQGFGMEAYYTEDKPHWLVDIIERLRSLPALINVRVCRHLWHAGSGTDGPPRWDAYRDFKEWLNTKLAVEDEADAIERETQEEMRALWSEKLK